MPALVVCPWTIRNAIVLKTFIPVSTNGGVTFLLGNSVNAGVNIGPNVDLSPYEAETRGMDEVQTDIHHRCAAWAWIINNPGDWARLYVLKVVNYFNFRNKLADDSESSFSRDAVMFLSYYFLLGAAIVRCFLWRRYPLSKTEWLCFGIYFANAFLAAIFFNRIRFRVPFDFLLVACVAIFIGASLRHGDRDRRNRRNQAVWGRLRKWPRSTHETGGVSLPAGASVARRGQRKAM